MKKTIVVLAVLLLLGTAAMAAVGPVEGKKFEFSTALGFSIQKYTYDDGWKETYTLFQVPLRFGFFLWKGLEFEPELLLAAERYKVYDDTGALAVSDHETGYILSGNLLYNFKMKSSRMIPFVLAGYGFGNGDLEGIDVDLCATGAKTPSWIRRRDQVSVRQNRGSSFRIPVPRWHPQGNGRHNNLYN